MRDLVFLRFFRGRLRPGDALLQLTRRDVDARVDVTLAQLPEDHLAAHFLAVGAVVDALLLQCRRQVAEPDVVALCHLGESLVQLLVRHLDPEARGALHLDFLDDQAFEHLLAQDVPRRHLLAGLLQAS